MKEILNEIMTKCDRPQALGIATLICLSQREVITMAYLHDEMNFMDIPIELVSKLDALSEDEQLELTSWIAYYYQPGHYAEKLVHEDYEPSAIAL